MNLDELKSLLICLKSGYLKLGNPNGNGICNYSFRVIGTEIDLVYFCDCGDWDYLDSVMYQGQKVLDFEDIANSELDSLALEVIEKYFPDGDNFSLDT